MRACPARLLAAALALVLLAGCPDEPEFVDVQPVAVPTPEPRPPPAAPGPPRKAPALPATEESPPAAEPAQARLELPPELVEALQGIEWEVIDAPPAAPLAWRVPDRCRLEYTDQGTLSLSEEGYSVKHSYFQSFALEKAGERKLQRKPGKRLEYVRLTAHGQSADGFVDPSAQRAQPVTLTVFDDRVELPSVLSPIFQLQRGAAFGQPSPMDVWPPLPAAGAARPWSYHLLFDTPETLRKQPPGKVELRGWLRLGLQRAAYLTATWPETGERLPIGVELAHLSVQGNRPKSSTLAQSRDIVGHYLVSEQGWLALARVDGMARVRNTYDVKEPHTGKPEQLEIVEERDFAFTTKLLSDCNGSLFAKAEATELPRAETVDLVEQFLSQIAADRLRDAAQLLSPAIRYAFPGDTPLYLLRGHFKALGVDSFGEPVQVAAGATAGAGVEFAGATDKGRKTYSTVHAARVGGRKVITFLGTSSRADRKSWDLLVVQPGSFSSGAVETFKPKL